MEPSREQKFQRVLQILTGATLLLIVSIVWKGFVGQDAKHNEERENIARTSVLNAPDAAAPNSPKPKKVKRAATNATELNVKPSLVQSLLEKEEKDGFAILGEGKYGEALEFYQKKAAANPKDSENYRILGDISFIQKDYKSAEEYYDLGLAFQPNDPRLFIKAVRSLLGQRKFIEAQKRLDETTIPNSPASEFYRGALYALLNQKEKSKEFLEKAKNGDDLKISEKAKRILSAYEEFDFTTDGKIEHLQALLAKAFDEIGEYQMAISIGLDALKSKEDYRDAWIVIGHAYFAEKKYSDANAAFNRAIELDSEIALTHFYLGLTNGALNEYEKAITELEKAESMGLDGGILTAQQKAKSFDKLGQFEKAYEWYVKILDLKGESAKPTEYVRPIVLALEQFQTPDKAYILANLNFSFHPRNPESFNLLGWTALELGKYDEAKKHLEQALSLDPTLAASYFNLGKLFEKQNDTAQARSYFEKTLELAKRKGDASTTQAAMNRLQSLPSEQKGQTLTLSSP